jgi:hypothetical protein
MVLGAVIVVGDAQANPLTLSNADLDQVTAGATLNLDVAKNIASNIALEVNKTVTAFSILVGHLADAEASSNAVGANSLSETLTIANVNQHAGKSESYSHSIAAANKDIALPIGP